MNILHIIDNATNEYITNGRNADFVAKENEIIDSQNMMYVYWFARYVEGADIDKLQSIILQNGSMEECYYFVKYVKDAQFKPFLQKALDEKRGFWVHKLVALAASPFAGRKNDLIEFKSQLENEYKIELESKRKGDIVGLKNWHIDKLVEDANAEYEKNGRSKRFIQLEKSAGITTGEGADIFLFAKHVPGASIKNLQRSLILHGNAFNIYLFAHEIKNSDAGALLLGIELAQRDYVAIQTKEKRKKEKLERCERDLCIAIDSKKGPKEISRLREELRQAELEESYSTTVSKYKHKLALLASENYQRNK